MRIAMVTTQYLPVISGVSFYTKQLSEALAGKGHEITVYTQGSAALKSGEDINGVFVRRFLPSVRLLRGYEILAGMREAVVEDSPELVHSHHYGYYPCIAGLEAARRLGVPHVFTPVLTPPVFGLVGKFLFKAYHSLHGRAVISDSDAVLALSLFEKKELVRLGAEKGNVHIVYNPVDTHLFRPHCPKRLKGRKLVVYAGPLGYAKGADVAFEIAKNLLAKRDDVVFLFVGGGPLKEQIVKKAKGYPGRFIFKSRIADRELAGWYSRASVFLLPTKYEAFGRASAEAMACSTPAVTTRVGAVPEVVLHKKTGFLVDYGNWDEMQSCVEVLLDNEKKCMEMGMAARRHVVKNFSEDAFIKRHEKIYTRLLQ